MSKPAQRIHRIDEGDSSSAVREPPSTGWDLGARHLRLVQAIHHTGSLGRAAETFFVTASALSHQLRQLERRCGMQLFNRVGTRLVINRAGRVLLEAAETVLPALDSARGTLDRMARHGPQVISLSTECYTCYHWLPRALRELRTAFGDVEFRIRADITRRPLPSLLEGDLDVAIVSQDLPETKGLISEQIFRDEMVVIAHPDHPLAKRAYVRPSDFRDAPALVYSADPSVSALLGDVLRGAGIQPARVIEVPLTEAIIELVCAGEGIALLAHWAVLPRLDPSSLVALRMGRQGFFRQWRAVCAANHPVAPLLPRIARVLAAEMSGGNTLGDSAPSRTVAN